MKFSTPFIATIMASSAKTFANAKPASVKEASVSAKSVKSKSSKCSAEKIAGFYSECYSCGGTFGLGVDNVRPGCYSFPTYLSAVDGTPFYTDQELKLTATTLDEDTVWIEGYNKYSYSANPEGGVVFSDTDVFVGLLDTNTCVFHLADTNENGIWDGHFDGDVGIHALQTEPNNGSGVGRVAKSSCKKID